MRYCERSDSKNYGPIGRVLNGCYPEAAVGRMSQGSLERLVSSLVKCTTDRADKPQWWPATIAYNRKINLGLGDEREIKLALKQLIVNCSQFFNKERDGVGNKWSVRWNDENQRKKKRTHRRSRPLVSLLPIPFVRLERPPSPGSSRKQQFFQYFRLNPIQGKSAISSAGAPPGNTLKYTNCIHIPFSSDVGQLMAAREQHYMSEDLKLKRLERSEWYINKETTKGTAEVEYETAALAKEVYYRNYKMPRRQFYQKRPGMYDADFLARFCTPVHVSLVRLDLDKLKGREGRQLMVIINQNEKMCCDEKMAKLVRSSPRLKNA